MPKAKLKVSSNELVKLANACEFSDVQTGAVKKLGDVSIVEVSYKQPSQLFELGRYIDKMSNESIAEQPAKAVSKKA